ncbi:hypothetical protein ACIA8E_38160 [Streptomyces sp. NPDC051664]|uniref:hypothetical protein n=1 Tax=Streptomyces sp. NPDC051664 TaxID=3365668 RepID=UPI0037B27BBC
MSAPTRRGFSGQIKRGPMAADVIGRNFAMVHNAAVRDARLSRRARGLLVEILSHRDGFGISMASLLASGPEGRDALTSALKELEQYGYLHRERERNELGQLGDTIFRITDMPEGLLIGAEAPWESEPPSEQKPRSEPKSENPRQVDETQKRRSEPKSDFPAQAEPAQAQPQHKKTNSSCSAGEDLSLSGSGGPSGNGSEGGGEREREAAPTDDKTQAPAAPAAVAVDEQHQEAERVVEAYAAAAGRPVINGTRARLWQAAVELLAAGLPAGWLADRAAEMPARGWVDLARHVERSTVPIPGQQQAEAKSTPEQRKGLPPWCGKCGDGGLNQAARIVVRWRTLGNGGTGELCPDCHPERVSVGA